MFDTRDFDHRPGVAKRPFRNLFPNLGGGLFTALAGGVLLGAVALSPATALANSPVTIDVTVTGAGGAPVSDAVVTVTQTGPQPVNPTALRGGAKTGANGTASIGTGSTPTNNRPPQPLPAGVYQVDVFSGGEHTTTYVYVPEGQTGTPTVDLSTATTMNQQGQSYSRAAEAAEAAQQAGDQAAYDAAVARVNEIIAYRQSANEALERAVEQYRRAHNIPASNLYRIGKLIKRHGEAVFNGIGDPSLGPALETYRDLLRLQEAWKNVLGVFEEARDGIPSFSYYRSAELDEDSEYADLGLPWRKPEVPGVAIQNPTYRVNLRFHHHY